MERDNEGMEERERRVMGVNRDVREEGKGRKGGMESWRERRRD